MEIHIDRAKCAGHAICTILAPDVFEMDDHGKLSFSPRPHTRPTQRSATPRTHAPPSQSR